MKNLSELKIGIANDHAGTDLKKYLVEQLTPLVAGIKNFGTDTNDSCDYPDYAHPLAESVEKGEVDLGIAICGSANGISMTCNKHQGVRCALSWETEIASLARQHNNANMIAFGARIVGSELAKDIVKSFLEAEFEGGGRHQTRIDMISAIENKN